LLAIARGGNEEENRLDHGHLNNSAGWNRLRITLHVYHIHLTVHRLQLSEFVLEILPVPPGVFLHQSAPAIHENAALQVLRPFRLQIATERRSESFERGRRQIPPFA
jgi:hypothetical protein